jgi:hypothetical protein
VAVPDVLLLLGHMRSGSTLLLHLLLTHPEFAALGERNVPYATAGDLARLALAARRTGTPAFRRLRYVVDQLNHNRLIPEPALLESPRLRVVFLLREPYSALASLLELSRAYYGGSWAIRDAVAYYVARLEGLTDLATRIGAPQRVAWVEYESLTATPEEILEALRVFLGLNVGFSSHYPTQPFTGQRGDPGTKIAAGRVLSGSQAPPVEFTVEQRSELRAVYARCRAALTPFALRAA